jgi:hypothetical protein
MNYKIVVDQLVVEKAAWYRMYPEQLNLYQCDMKRDHFDKKKLARAGNYLCLRLVLNRIFFRPSTSSKIAVCGFSKKPFLTSSNKVIFSDIWPALLFPYNLFGTK